MHHTSRESSVIHTVQAPQYLQLLQLAADTG